MIFEVEATTLNNAVRKLDVSAELGEVESKMDRLKAEVHHESPNEAHVTDLLDELKAAHQRLKSMVKGEEDKKKMNETKEEEGKIKEKENWAG